MWPTSLLPRSATATPRAFRIGMAAAAALRLALIAFGLWQDASFAVKYTDVDYEVCCDAAALVAAGGSPFGRTTYRYSPLLAFALLPTVWVHRSAGKVLFAIADVAVALLLREIITSTSARASNARRPPPAWDRPPREGMAREDGVANFWALVWLFNPLAANMCSRGNADALVLALVLGTVLLLLPPVPPPPPPPPPRQCNGFGNIHTAQDSSCSGGGGGGGGDEAHHTPAAPARGRARLRTAAALFGLAVHFRIYPVVYAPAFVVHVWTVSTVGGGGGGGSSCSGRTGASDRGDAGSRWWCTRLGRVVEFGGLSFGVFALLTSGTYVLYGYEGLYESLLYHAVRADNRHNFSAYFYALYLRHGSPLRLAAFLPQLVLPIVLAVKLVPRSLCLCLYATTVVFVVFNKVCTAQYFMWWAVFLPILLPRIFRQRPGHSSGSATAANSAAPQADREVVEGAVAASSSPPSSSVSSLPEAVAAAAASAARPARLALLLAVLWAAAEGHWLFWAYQLEFEGRNTFFELWVAGLVFVVVNVAVMVAVVRGFDAAG